MFFASDNWAGAAEPIVEAIARHSGGYAHAYGASAHDRAVEERFNALFEREVAVFFVGTGSAANALGLAAVSRPGGVVFCQRESHVVEDECGGVEFQTGGGRLLPLGGPAGKIDPDALAAALARFSPDFVHAGQPMAVTVSQATEAGTAYGLDELREIAEIAEKAGIPLHMDGSRFANALVRLGVSPAEMTWKSGVDVLSFGATKNGCICAEALVVFDPAKAKDIGYIRKRAGHLFSKSRFVAAQFDAYFRDDLWLDLARRANGMADRLRTGLVAAPDARQAWPTETNEIFVVLKRETAERLRQAGAVFYDWSAAPEFRLDDDESLHRLVTSFSTTEADVDGFLAVLGR